MALDTLVAMEVFYLFSVRYAFGSALTLQGLKGTPAVLIAVVAVVALQLLLTRVPLLNLLFGTAPLSLVQLLQCVVPGVVLLVVLELDRRMAAFWKTLAARSRVPD
jgi:magnesium-transporting ATPase (P-type)